MKVKLGFIGFGEIAKMITQGLLSKKVIAKEDISACAIHQDKLKDNCKKFGIKAATIETIVKDSDVIILAVRPDNFKDVKDKLKDLPADTFVISVMASYTSEQFKVELPDTKIIAAVPNVCVASAKGIFICDLENSLDKKTKKIFTDLITPIADIYYQTPKAMSIASTIAGCTPAYVAMFTEALSEAAVHYGLSRHDAYQIIADMMIGTATMMKDGLHPAMIKDLVASPAGSTIKGIIKLEDEGFRSTVIEAIKAVEE